MALFKHKTNKQQIIKHNIHFQKTRNDLQFGSSQIQPIK